MKKIVTLMMTFAMCLCFVLPVHAAPSDSITEVTTASQNQNDFSRAVSLSEDFSCETGKSWSTSFTTDKWFSDDHNAFKTIIDDFSGGSYKVIIEGSNGYSYTSSEYTSGHSFTTRNAKSNVTYTVYIVNTGSGTISGNVKISSFYD